jgi:hypothetical protein
LKPAWWSRPYFKDMKLTYVVEFPHGVPVLDDVLTRLKQVTNLTLLYDAEHFVLHSVENSMALYVVQSDTEYELYKHNASPDYLLWSLIHTLALMGGKTDVEIPSWIGKKWDELA